MIRKYLIIGLGRFGTSLIKELHNKGHEVVGCDHNTFHFDEVNNFADYLVEGDSTDATVLEELNVLDFDYVIVSIGDNFEAAILTVTKLKNMGCKKIISKANDQIRAQALKAVGADLVILPEEESGIRLAVKISSPGFLERFDLGPYCSGVEVEIPKLFIGKTLIEIDLRKKYNVTLVLIKRKGKEYPIISPDPNEELKENDVLFIVGENKFINKLQKKYYNN